MQQPAVSCCKLLGLCDGTVESLTFKMPLGGAGQMVVPDPAEGVIKTDPLEAMIESQLPPKLARPCGEHLLGQFLETCDQRATILFVHALSSTCISGPKPISSANAFHRAIGRAPPAA